MITSILAILAAGIRMLVMRMVVNLMRRMRMTRRRRVLRPSLRAATIITTMPATATRPTATGITAITATQRQSPVPTTTCGQPICM
jgi:hypothetical protein